LPLQKYYFHQIIEENNFYAIGYVFLGMVLLQTLIVKLDLAPIIQKIYFLGATVAFLVLALI